MLRGCVCASKNVHEGVFLCGLCLGVLLVCVHVCACMCALSGQCV